MAKIARKTLESVVKPVDKRTFLIISLFSKVLGRDQRDAIDCSNGSKNAVTDKLV